MKCCRINGTDGADAAATAARARERRRGASMRFMTLLQAISHTTTRRRVATAARGGLQRSRPSRAV